MSTTGPEPAATPRGSRPWPGALEWGGDWLADATAELVHLGFEVRDGSRPGTVPGPRLLVALRPAPTLEHFDPEEIVFWVEVGGRGVRHELRRDMALPGDGEARYEWGRILIADRIPVTNQFLSFGGRLLTGSLADGTVVAAFVSRAPIVRWSGHSQGVDPLADEIGAFFARVKVPIDYQPEAEARVARSAPEAIYAAFLVHSSRRLRASRLAAADPVFARFVAHEAHRLEADVPQVWRDGTALLDWLELG